MGLGLGLGLGSISLRLAFGQPLSGLTQPMAGALILSLGWVAAMRVMRQRALLCLPAAYVLRGNSSGMASAPGSLKQPTGEAVRTAWADHSFRLLAVLGRFNIIGSLVMGWAIDRRRMT